MSLWRAVWLAWNNIKQTRRSFFMASVGLIVGVATGTFFVALGLGVQDGVLNKIYPVNQVEIEPKKVAVMGFQRQVLSKEVLDEGMVEDLQSVPGVTRVYPKLRAKIRARIWGGEGVFGNGMRGEAFFDGLDPALLESELREREETAKPPAVKKRRAVVCIQDEECPLGQECQEGACTHIRYWKKFTNRNVLFTCKVDTECPAKQHCNEGLCRTLCTDDDCAEGTQCVSDPLCAGTTCRTICAPNCQSNTDCDDGQACNLEKGSCESLRCALEKTFDQNKALPKAWKGMLKDRCAGGVAPDDPACQRLPCPGSSYCAVSSVDTKTGYCEEPIPVVMSPFLVEIFNSTAVEALGINRIEGVQALMGGRIRLKFGASIFGDKKGVRQVVKRAEIVGFSDKALDLGLTMPLGIVRAINARFAGREAAKLYSTFILETEDNEDVSGVIAEIKGRGFELSRKSQDARKAADMLFILTLVFTFISLVIAGVAALNIGNTFLMIIHQRRYEIGIMRATGASRGDVARLILIEASFMGVGGGALGLFLSYGCSRLANWVAADQLQFALFKPENFFIYEWWIVAGGLGVAWCFCMIGAWIPARRAAKLDPAEVLTS
jgi:ABC-type lipoprotein release transport system permease subunit